MADVNTGDKEEADSDGQSFTVEEAIETIGFGKFQIKVLAMIGFAWSADSLEMALLAILAPAIRCYWNLTHWHEAFLTTVVFVGMFLATYLWGYGSDNYGRRKVLMVATFGIFVFGLTSAFALNYAMILVFRGLVGTCMGGVVQGTTLIVEFLPSATRGLTVNIGSIFWSLGTSFEIILAMFVMPRYGWRVLLFVSAWPCLIFVIIALIIKYPPESARFLVSKGRIDEASTILKHAAKDNKSTLPEGTLRDQSSEVEKNDHGNILAMFKNGYWKVTIALWIIWFASHFNIYGLALLTTALFSSSYTCYGSVNSTATAAANSCKVLTQEDYVSFFYVLLADFPAVLLTAFLADTVGRKWLQAIGFFNMGIFFSLLAICTGSRAWTTVILFGVRCFAAVADIGGYIYTPEVYPTHIRGMALGSCSGISRLGCMLTPFVSQVVTHYSVHLSLAIYVSLSLLGGICSLLLPIETKGKGLEEINNDLKSLSKDFSAVDVSCAEECEDTTRLISKDSKTPYG